MEDKTKFYIFDKKEIALIFTFMVLATVIAFILGVKFGLNYSYDSSGLALEDRDKVELLSGDEESVQQVEESHVTKKINVDETYSQLKDEFDRLQDGEKNEVQIKEEPTEKSKVEAPSQTVREESASDVVVQKSKHDRFYNKYTIQLGSYRSVEDAKQFANGFKVRGYDPIVNPFNIHSKGGIWYRVSIGVFDSSSKAKEYIIKNQSLFQSHNDYIIGKFD